MPQATMDRRDLGWAVALAALALVLYLALGQERVYGDGTGLIGFAHLGGGDSYHHVLYTPVARFFAETVPAGQDLVLGPRLASQLPAALGVAGCFLLLRALGLGRRGAGLGVGLVGLAPCWLFFATTVEVHALHAGIAPWVFLAVLRAPWGRPGLGFGLGFGVAAVGLGLLYGTHQSGALLGLGMVLLCGRAAADAGRPLGPGRQWLMLAPALLAALFGAIALTSLVRFGVMDPFRELTEARDLADGASEGVSLGALGRARESLRSLGLLGPLALVGLIGAPRGSRALAAATAGLGLVVVVAWGVVERGGYFLAYLPFVAWPAAVALERLPATWARWAQAALLAQGALAVVPILQFDRGLRLEDRRLALLEAMDPQGTGQARGHVVTLVGLAPPATAWWPGVREHALGSVLVQAALQGATVEDAAAAAAALEVLLGPDPLVVDATPRARLDLLPSQRLAPHVVAGFHAIERRFVCVSFERGDWVLWRIDGLRPAADRRE